MTTNIAIEVALAIPTFLALGSAAIFGLFAWMSTMFGIVSWFSSGDKTEFAMAWLTFKVALVSAGVGGFFAACLHLYRVI